MSSATLAYPRAETYPKAASYAWLGPAVAVLLLAVQISPYWYPTPDSTAYLSIARNLSRHQTLQNLGSDQLYYSLGYPLLISPVFLVTDEPFLLISAIHFVLALLLLWGIWLWVRDYIPQAASGIAILSLLNVSFWEAYRRTLSEVAFMVVLVWVVLILNRIRAAAVSGRRFGGMVIVASVLLIYLAMIRPAGIFVAAGFGTTMLLAATSKQLSWTRAITLTLAVGVPATLVLAMLILRDKSLAASAGTVNYLDQIRDPEMGVFAQLLEGLRLRIFEMGRLLLPGMYKSYARRGEWLNINLLLYLPLCAAVLIGWAKFIRARPDVLAWTFPFYLALYVVWPFDQATRFFMPLTPLFLVCLWFTLSALGNHRVRLMTCLAVAHAAVALGYWCFDGLPHARATETRWPAVREMAKHMEAEPGPVQVSEALDDTGLLLQFTLDRSVRSYRVGSPPDAQTKWLVLSDHEVVADGFVIHARRGTCLLCRRQSASVAMSRTPFRLEIALDLPRPPSVGGSPPIPWSMDPHLL